MCILSVREGESLAASFPGLRYRQRFASELLFWTPVICWDPSGTPVSGILEFACLTGNLSYYVLTLSRSRWGLPRISGMAQDSIGQVGEDVSARYSSTECPFFIFPQNCRRERRKERKRESGWYRENVDLVPRQGWGFFTRTLSRSRMRSIRVRRASR